MCIDTNAPKHWNPYRALAITGAWLVLVVLAAVMISNGCGSTPPAPTTGSISLAWSITDLGGKPATCAQVAGRSVALRLRDRASGHVVATAFPCETTPGTAQVAAGTYDVVIELHAADGTTLATAPDQAGARIMAGQVARLLPVRFAASTQGSLVVSIATPATTNCQPVEAGGAGITGTSVTLERTGSGCAAVTFIRMLGSTPRGTYTVNCSSPLIAACVENTETLTTSVEPGTYLLHVRGKLGTLDCWQRDDTLVIPPPGKPLTHTVGLMRQSIPGC